MCQLHINPIVQNLDKKCFLTSTTGLQNCSAQFLSSLFRIGRLQRDPDPYVDFISNILVPNVIKCFFFVVDAAAKYARGSKVTPKRFLILSN